MLWAKLEQKIRIDHDGFKKFEKNQKYQSIIQQQTVGGMATLRNREQQSHRRNETRKEKNDTKAKRKTQGHPVRQKYIKINEKIWITENTNHQKKLTQEQK